jgi:hypothetical protein
MWVVFYSKTILGKNGKEKLDKYESPKLVDISTIHRSEEEAVTRYNEILKEDLVYCAGYAPIAGGTEPQWVDGGS